MFSGEFYGHDLRRMRRGEQGEDRVKKRVGRQEGRNLRRKGEIKERKWRERYWEEERKKGRKEDRTLRRNGEAEGTRDKR